MEACPALREWACLGLPDLPGIPSLDCTEEYLTTRGVKAGLPSAAFPSDHLPIAVRLAVGVPEFFNESVNESVDESVNEGSQGGIRGKGGGGGVGAGNNKPVPEPTIRPVVALGGEVGGAGGGVGGGECKDEGGGEGENGYAHDVPITIVLVAFGAKYGVLKGCDYYRDIRHLPSPWFVRDYKARTGRDGVVSRAFFKDSEVEEEYEEAVEWLRDDVLGKRRGKPHKVRRG